MPARQLPGARSPSPRRQADATPAHADAHPSAPHAAAATRDQAVLAAALDPIITIDIAGTIQSASDSVQRVFGWKPIDLIGRNVCVLMPEPHRSAHDGYLERYHATGRTNILNRPRRFDAVRRDGTLFPMELSVSRADIPGQSSPLFVGIIRDMSEHAGAERHHGAGGAFAGAEDNTRLHELLAEQTSALQTAHLRLRMADRMASIGVLAAGLGHDMNNVLLPVRARVNALKAAGASGLLAAKERQHVEGIAKSVAYLQQLADGLHFLALDPEDEDSERASTDVCAWWAQTGALLAKAVPKHVKVTASLTAGLPEVRVAAHGLTQAVLNLVVNAGEAIPADRKRRQGRVRVWAETTGDGAHVRLCVTDNGRGMSEEVRRRAFEMFYTTKPRGLGTGLGLALVRKVADRAGASVEIESQPGKGTTVVMVLPVATRAARQSGAPSAVISLKDGRAAALIRHLLEVAGVRAGIGDNPADADIWVAEPTPAGVDDAKAWRMRSPGGRLVLFGKPGPRSARAWNTLRPVTIEDRDDLDTVRAALGRAVAGS